MNAMEAIQHPTKDQDWITKVIIAVVLVFIPIFGWLILSGYGLRLTKNVITGTEELPEWGDWVGDLTRGFMAAVGGFIYYLPSFGLSIVNSILGLDDNVIFVVLSCVVSLAQFAYSIIVIPFLYSATARYAFTEDFNVYLDFSGRLNDVTSRTNDVIQLFINYLIIAVVGFIAIMVGLFMLCLPMFAAIAYFQLVNAAFIGQWGRIIMGGQVGGTPMNAAPGF